MGILDNLRSQFIDIVEFLDDSRDTIVYRFERHNNEIKNGAQLIVREGQVAVFESEGQIADVFTPGTYTLETRNLPILSDLKGWKYGFESPFKAEVYFVGTRLYTDMKWGTQNPVTMRDAEFGMVRLRAFGTYALQVVDAGKLIRQLVGTDPQFRTDEVSEFLRQTIVGQVGTALASSNIPMLDLAANQQTIAATLGGTLTTNLADMGIAIPRFVIENISLPPEVEEVLDKRTSMGVMGNLDQYTKYQTATAIGDAANNPGGAGEGLGLGFGVALGQQMAGALAGQNAGNAGANQSGPPPLPGAALPFYLGVNGQQVGPVPPSDLAARVTSGELTQQTPVWKQGMAAWTPAGEVAELAPLFASVPPPLPPQPGPTPPQA
ncbi:SPFH domain-containing protein [Jatrophihabitans sp. YIM 134969]